MEKRRKGTNDMVERKLKKLDLEGKNINVKGKNARIWKRRNKKRIGETKSVTSRRVE
jgi:hypothetical protein